MKTRLVTMLCLLLGVISYPQQLRAQQYDLENRAEAIRKDLNQKAKEFSWRLMLAYADYAESNLKYISWTGLPYLEKIVEFERPASLETYRIASEESKKQLQDYLSQFDEYTELQEKRLKAITKEQKEAFKVESSVFYTKLRNESDTYRTLTYANKKAVSKYRAEAMRYMVADYQKTDKEVPTNTISYKDRSALIQTGSELERLEKEISALRNVQNELIRTKTRTQYGLDAENGNVEDTEKNLF